jgi:hypothetical protein
VDFARHPEKNVYVLGHLFVAPSVQSIVPKGRDYGKMVQYVFLLFLCQDVYASGEVILVHVLLVYWHVAAQAATGVSLYPLV